ncbi:MAG TPA: hypothetical protein VE133_05040 [Candidatus Sulfotelmatobacter sp.]|nr:hypothetical protein [Candidatus Sulfotelmatobacter sp.]
MKSRWISAVLLSGMPLYAWQGSTPQAALEEIATATKPEAITRHLPEPVQKSIEALPKIKKQEVMDQLLELKDSQLGALSVRTAHDGDGWELLDEKGENKGRVRIDNAFISGLDAILPIQVEVDGESHSFIVTMHLEGSEWRIADFGPWEKTDLGLAKLLHESTEMEKNEAAAEGNAADHKPGAPSLCSFASADRISVEVKDANRVN